MNRNAFLALIIFTAGAFCAPSLHADTITATLQNLNGMDNFRRSKVMWYHAAGGVEGKGRAALWQSTSVESTDLGGQFADGTSGYVPGTPRDTSTSFDNEFVSFAMTLLNEDDMSPMFQSPRSYEVETLAGLGGSKAGMLGVLWQQFFSLSDFGSDYNKAAGFQIAIWEILNESAINSLDLESGDFGARIVSLRDVTKAGTPTYWGQQYLDFVNSNPTAPRAELRMLNGDIDQLAEVTATPEPSTIVMAVMGLSTLVGYRGWRRVRRAKPC